MSYQQQPPTGVPGLGPGEAHAGANDVEPGLDAHARAEAEASLQEMLGGELPGEGLWFPEGAAASQPIIGTNPERVRSWLLRAIEVAAEISTMPYGEQPPETCATAALRFAQAYLLLDPSVDEQGVPIAAKAGAQAGAAVAQAHGQAAAQAAFTPPPPVGGFQGPPRRNLPPAAQAIANANKGKSEVLRDTRGQMPRPRPRVNQ